MRAFSLADAQAAWAAGIAVLSSWGVREVQAPRHEPWLSLSVGEAQRFFEGPPEFGSDALSVVGAALTGAWLRVEEAAAHARLEERYRMISQASFEGLLIHEDGKVLHVNERLCEILARPREELHGSNVISLVVAPDDQPVVIQRMQSGFEGAYVLRGVRSDGTVFPAELQSKQGHLGQRPIRVVAVRDVAEREEMLSLLRESETRLRYLTDAMFDLTVLSQDGVMVDAKGPLLESIGFAAEHLIGRKILDFVAPSEQMVSKRQVESSSPGRYETTLVDAAGELVPIEVIAVNSTLNGQPVRVAGIRDLRDQRRQEVERRALQQRVERAQRTESLGVLAGGIAHDFNNLLVSVLGNAEILVADATDEESKLMLESIILAAERAAELTTRLLVYAGRGELGPPSAFNVSTLLDELVRLLLKRDAEASQIQSEIESGCFVLGDRASLTQVLLNLLTNAIDASSPDDEAIAVRLTNVTELDDRWDDSLGATVRPGSWILIEVEDFGVGMDAVTQSRVFEPFFSTKSTGHGLGMAGCLGIIENHNGALHVRSELGRGSCFSLLFPASSPNSKQVVINTGDASAPCRVLVVDDEPMVREQLRRTLTLRGYNVTEADSARSGLAVLQDEAFDVVLMDIIMPGMSGTEAISELRSRGCETPVIFVSGYFDTEHQKGLEQLSFQGFLRKPYSISDLLAAVEAARRT